MMTDVMIQKKGIEALIKELGNVDAERFINIAINNPFDYTVWRKTNVHESISVRELSKKAMAVEKKINDSKVMDLIFDAWKEKETTGIVSTKCPNCNDTIEIVIVGNSAKTKCSCGLMNRKLRGI